ncbi:MAG: hypothetical protein DMG09_12215, partial [Acidobacteria bacterium]
MRNKPIVVIIIASLFLGASTLTRGHDWGDDFASYIMQAGSILSGRTREFVEHNSFTIFESSSQIGPVAYPWGYPLILSPIRHQRNESTCFEITWFVFLRGIF